MEMISIFEHENETCRLERINRRLTLALIISVAVAGISCTVAILGGV